MDESLSKTKPWYRLRNIAIALLALIVGFAVWVAQEVWNVYRAQPNPTVDYRTQFRLLSQSEMAIAHDHEDEAWSLLMETLELNESTVRDFEQSVKDAGFEARDDTDSGIVEFERIFSNSRLSADIERERRALAVIEHQGVFKDLGSLRSSRPGFGHPIEMSVCFCR